MHSQLRLESPLRCGSAAQTLTMSGLPWMMTPVTCSFIALVSSLSMHFGGLEKLQGKTECKHNIQANSNEA
eukprot:61659-Pleurochrysis_carterae.AAC.1